MRRFLLPIRWRLALTSAGLTFVILLGFAGVIAAFTASSLRSNLDSGIAADASDIASRLPTRHGLPTLEQPQRLALKIASPQDSTIRVLSADKEGPPRATVGKTALGPVNADAFSTAYDPVCHCTYRVYTKPVFLTARNLPKVDSPTGYVQVGRLTTQLDSTIRQVDIFLALGVLVGTGLALLAGLAVARRAMGPISDLTYVARHVSRTRDPGVTLPRTRANDEVADLARTLEAMLKALEQAQSETEATLTREREFVADASHELRTPLTSVLANLEILQAELQGDQEEVVESALRSTQRMRRLVADLLFLANADTGRETPHEPVDLGRVVRDAAAETAPITSTHQVRLEAPAGIFVSGAADDLHRLVVNLIQNAVNHTPEGSVVRVRLRRRDGAMRPTGGDEPEAAVLEISDNGPGIPPETRERIFERFVRAPNALASESARGGSGLGLAIVDAVAAAHSGSVKLSESPDGGARFVVRIPTTASPEPAPTPAPAEPRAPGQTSTTTGSTRGRLFRRS
ncbi:MAG: hypothetical protein QOG62_1843 [Thermoleophilaceae bacterium]|jgi:signal transduction histidine kinase|nr:hypothetical protein [Thermoleophilaceae bacterium]